MTGLAPAPGRVVLVGAGPGDVELLTLKAARLIAEADWLVHDALVQPEMLALARHARVISVGKRAGNPSARQSSINRILLDCAHQGGLTVRLKGGDPLIFARAQEELDVLHAAGIPVEVVPGISSAQAAHAALALPMTERGRRRALVLATPQVHAPDQRNTAMDMEAGAHSQAEEILQAGTHFHHMDAEQSVACVPRPVEHPPVGHQDGKKDFLGNNTEADAHFHEHARLQKHTRLRAGTHFQKQGHESAVLAALQQVAAPVPTTRRRVMSAAEIVADPELRRWAEAIVAAGSGTLYMAATVATQVRDTLLMLGMDPATPTLWMLDVSLPGQEIIPGTLGTLTPPPAALKGKPALLLVGVPASMGA